MESRSDQSHANEAAIVDLIEVCDEWYVRILDLHGRQIVKTFSSEDAAIAFAEDELRRLGIEGFHRL